MIQTWYLGGLKNQSHGHEHALLVTSCSGGATQIRYGHEDERPPGMHRFHINGEEHMERVAPFGWETLMVEFQPGWLAQLQHAGVGFLKGFDSWDAEAYQVVRRLSTAISRDSSSLGSQMRIRGLVYELIGTFLDGHAPIDSAHAPIWLSKAHELILSTYRERPTVDSIAAAVHVHPVHLARSFRKHYGITVTTFLKSLIVEDAARRIADGNGSIAQIANSLGYSASHFAGLIRKRLGVSPKGLRR